MLRNLRVKCTLRSIKKTSCFPSWPHSSSFLSCHPLWAHSSSVRKSLWLDWALRVWELLAKSRERIGHRDRTGGMSSGQKSRRLNKSISFFCDVEASCSLMTTKHYFAQGCPMVNVSVYEDCGQSQLRNWEARTSLGLCCSGAPTFIQRSWELCLWAPRFSQHEQRDTPRYLNLHS